MGNYLDRLNTNQKRAVMTTEGPLLVLAVQGAVKQQFLRAGLRIYWRTDKHSLGK